MKDINLVVVSGRITKDGIVKQAGSSTVCEFGIANNSGSKKNADGTWTEYPASFFDIQIWKPSEYVTKNITKGSAVTIEGNVRQQTWEDKTTKQKRSKVIIVSEQVIFHNPIKADRGVPPTEGYAPANTPPTAYDPTCGEPPKDDGVPF